MSFVITQRPFGLVNAVLFGTNIPLSRDLELRCTRLSKVQIDRPKGGILR